MHMCTCMYEGAKFHPKKNRKRNTVGTGWM